MDEESELEEYKKAYNYSIRILSRRDYSRHKLETKLFDKGYPSQLVANLLDELVDKKYLREDYYIESRVKGLLRKGWSTDRVKYHLEKEKCPIDDSKIREICEQAGIDTTDVLLEQVQKKWGHKTSLEDLDYQALRKKKDKVLRYLVSKGHQFSESKAALEEFLSTH